MSKLRKRLTLGLESLESRVVLQGQGIGIPFEGLPEPPFETPPVDVPAAPPTNGRPVIVHPLGGPGRPETSPPDPQVPPFGEPEAAALVVDIPPAPPEVIPPVDLPDQVPIDVPPAPPTNGRPVIVHPLGGPGRPETTPPDPQVPPFGEPEAAALVVDIPPAPPEVIPPVDLPDQVPIDVPPAPPTNGRPVIVHPLGGPGRPETTPPDPQVPPFGEPEAAALVVDIPPAPPEVIPPVDLPDQVPIDVPPAPPTNGRPVIVHPLGGPGRPESTPPDPQVPPFGEPAASALVVGVSRTAETTVRARMRSVTLGDVASVDAAHTQAVDAGGLSVSRSSTTRRSRGR